MRVRLLFSFYLLVCYILTIQGQHPYAWNLTIEDGLPSSEVYDLYQDTKGYIWIGTDKGLCKYNGNKFFYYQNKEELSEAVSGIQEDSMGRIWVQNFKDQIFYVENDSLHYFEIPSKITVKDFLVGTTGEIWVTDKRRDSLYCYKQDGRWKSWRVFAADTTLDNGRKGIVSIIEGANNIIYLTSSYGLFKCVDDKVHFITNKNFARSSANSRSILPVYLFKDNENSLFFLQSEKGNAYQISQLIGEDQVGIVWNSFRSDFYDARNHTLRVDNENTIWQLTLDAGLGPIFNSSATSKTDSTLLLFPNEGISDFVIDREGNYWISSLSRGVHIIPSLQIYQYTTQNSILEYDGVGKIEKKDDETIFIETGKEKIVSLNVKENVIEDEFKIPKGSCNQLYWSRGMLLVNGNIYQEIHIPSAIPSKKYEFKPLVIAMRNSFFYKKNNIVNLTSTGSAISSFSPNIGSQQLDENLFSYIKTQEVVNFDVIKYNKLLTKLSSFCGIPDAINNRILIARDDSLMCYPERSHPFAILDVEGNAIRGVYMERDQKKDIIWVCTINSGIYGLNKDLKIKYHFSIRDNLISNKIQKLKIDGEHLWLLSNQGIQRFTPKNKESRIYTVADGIPTHEIQDIAVVGDRVWLSTAKGLVSFDKKLPSQNLVSPSIYLKRIAIHDKDTALASHYHLNYKQNSLTIYLEGISYKSRGNFKYTYRMLGIDSSWISQPSTINVMRFPQLNPGNYLFQVKAINEDGIASNRTIDVQFVIDKPYWKIWWVQGLFGLSIVLVIVAIVLARFRNKQREEQQQNKMNLLQMQALQSQMNPHFIFNILTAVQNLWLQHKNELAMDLQSNFAKLLRKIFQYSSKKVISMDQIKDFLENYLNLEQIRFENQVQIDFKIEEDLLDGYFIPPLLIQPIIENSFKHGLFHKPTDKQLKISIQKEGAYVYCCVEDNGIGRPAKTDMENVKRSSGLKTTQKRLLILQQDVLKVPHPYNNLKITDLKTADGSSRGTRVEFWIPFITSDL
ncbi:histidine kinase [Aureispira sp. CCB-E]|uniref:sensor histidine kinase n=1 Tax=Aureispira sp. CCB-E TaxID=3051121 RepID=UPI002869468D|nr:histidine kinase [Aureispira sp. CCB-E]WMX14684.1 histidine kinase [Aureispira sp. CCB-E]